MRNLFTTRGLPLAAAAVLAIAGAGCGDDDPAQEEGQTQAPTETATDGETPAGDAAGDDTGQLFEDRDTLVGERATFTAEVSSVVSDTAVEVAGEGGDPILVVNLDPESGALEQGQQVQVSGDVRVFDEEEMAAEYPYDDSGFYWDEPVWGDYDGTVIVVADQVEVQDGGTASPGGDTATETEDG